MRSRKDELVSILCPFQGKKYEKISKKTKKYEKIKFRVFKHLSHNCLILNKLEKPGGRNPCFPATPIIYLSSIDYKDIHQPCDQISINAHLS